MIDLLHELPRAEKRPTNLQLEVAEHTFSSVRHASIVAPAPSRIIWTLQFPARGIVRTWIAVLPTVDSSEASVTFRLGVSDDRLYDLLTQLMLTTSDSRQRGWVPLSADVSLYGGAQWSLFYRPDNQRWRLVFSADAGHSPAKALWAAPGVETDSAGARAWWHGRSGRR